MRGARESGVINIFLVSRLDGIRRLGCVGAGKVCAGIGGRGESAMIAWTVHSQTAGKACQCQMCGQSKIAACAALECVPKLINPQLWMARHNICASHFDLECVSKIPECAISDGAAQFLRHKARPSAAKRSGFFLELTQSPLEPADCSACDKCWQSIATKNAAAQS